MSSVTIRSADAADQAWLVAAHAEVYSSEFGFDPDFRADIEGKLAALRAQADAFTQIWIALVDEQRAGTIAISRRGADTAFINFLLVGPDFRRRGLARALMDLALEHAEHHRFRQVRLETYSCLDKARALYAALGFRIAEAPSQMHRYGRDFAQEFWQRPLPRDAR